MPNFLTRFWRLIESRKRQNVHPILQEAEPPRPASPLSSLTLATAPLFALPTNVPIPAKVLEVYDGDTLTVAVEVFPATFRSFRMRLDGVDTPELHPPLSAPGREKLVAAAQAARRYLHGLVADAVVFIVISGVEKYGRQLGRVYLDEEGQPGQCVNDLILVNGFGRHYEGGSRQTNEE
jgi:endonuclease YncB( thermonuclease family)